MLFNNLARKMHAKTALKRVRPRRVNLSRSKSEFIQILYAIKRLKINEHFLKRCLWNFKFTSFFLSTHQPLVIGDIITLRYMAQAIKRIFTLSLLPFESQSTSGTHIWLLLREIIHRILSSVTREPAKSCLEFSGDQFS